MGSAASQAPRCAVDHLRRHWPEYLMEAGGLGTFMISACTFGTLLFLHRSPVVGALPDPFLRRLLMGLAMGFTALGIIYSKWGQQSGAHLNPAVTLAFLRLGRIRPWDAVFYVLAQFLGGLAGVAIAVALLREHLSDPSVNYVVTSPGPWGTPSALVAEAIMAFALMATVLFASTRPRLAPWTGLGAATLVAVYITFEAPVSGMSLNPARSFASALPAQVWHSLWIYFVGPPLGMQLAVLNRSVFVPKGSGSMCAKLHHDNARRCIHCGKPGRSHLFQ